MTQATSLFLPPIAVIDVETTGLFPARHDRVVEVAAVVMGPDGSIEREFSSLINPDRDVGPSSIHGISAADIGCAPRFGEIASQLLDALGGTVVVAGHNVRFDLNFLDSEFQRLGSAFPRSDSLCTMNLSGGGKLADCCSRFGISFDGEAHQALTDARATARLLLCLLAERPDLRAELSKAAAIRWPVVPRIDRRPMTRQESLLRQTSSSTFVRQLLHRMGSREAKEKLGGSALPYLELLDRVLEDRHVDEAEAAELLESAVQCGLTEDLVLRVHREYFQRLCRSAVADGVVTPSEGRDLQLVAKLLDLASGEIREALDSALVEVPGGDKSDGPCASYAKTGFAGESVCFTGELRCRYQGSLMSREAAERLATNAGMIVVANVSKKLGVLVVADPETQSGKAKKARMLGIRVVHEPVFWNLLEIEVE